MIEGMGKIDLPGLHRVVVKGRVYWYYRKRGRNARQVRLPGEPGSEAFMQAYLAERAKDGAEQEQTKTRLRSFHEAARIYFASSDFRALRDSTKRAYRSSLRSFLEEYGDLPVADLRPRHVMKIMGDMEDRPAAANNRLKRLRALISIAIMEEWISADPTRGVKMYRVGEIHTWTEDEQQAFEARWPEGSRERLAYMLQLYTGQRRSDVVQMTWPRDGAIKVVQVKGRRRESDMLTIPVDPRLAEELARHPKSHAVILTTSFGKPFTSAGYGNWMRDAIREAGLPDRCSSHGLRKAAAKHLAEAGCTPHEIQSITGHESLAEVERYTRAAGRAGLAERAASKRESG